MTLLQRAALLGVICLAPWAAQAETDGDFVWARSMGGTYYDQGNGITVDGAGNVYTTGYFRGTVDFDPGAGTVNLTSAGERDIFVQKLDASGSLVWARSMGGTDDDYGLGIAVDGAGNVYTTGYFYGTADFDPGEGTFNLTSAGNADIFVQKLDTNGNLVWGRSMGGANRDLGISIAVDSAGSIHTIGDFEGTVDFDPGADTVNLTSAWSADIFVQKLDARGNLVWARRMGGMTDWDHGGDITVDRAGNVYTTGYFMGDVDFDPGSGVFTLFNERGRDSFVQKLDTSGSFVWARGIGGTGSIFFAQYHVNGTAIALDEAGKVYATGYFNGTADFDPGPGTMNLRSAGGTDYYVLKLDSSGTLAWARHMGGTNSESSYGIAVDGTGNVCSTGTFEGRVDFDPGAGTANLTSEGQRDIFLQKLDASGNLAWARRMGGTLDDIGYGIAVDGAGNVYTTGDFQGAVDFDPGAGTVELRSAGEFDIFVQKLGPDVTPPNTTAIVPETAGPTNAESLGFTITFDDDVQNFSDAADLVITHNGTASTGATISGGPVEYTVTISGISGDGSFTLAVNTESDVKDDCGNPLASSVVSAAVAIDNTPPAFKNIASIPAEVEAGNPVLLTFDSTEPLSGDPEVTVNGNPATLSQKAAYGYTYIALESDATGPAAIEIRGMDIAGNAGVTIDTTAFSIIEAMPEGEGALEGALEGTLEGATEGGGEGSTEGAGEGMPEGAVEGVEEGAIEGSPEGQEEGEEEGATEGDVEGIDEGEVEGSTEGSPEGMTEGEIEGAIEGGEEGALEGEVEGDTDGEIHPPVGCNAFNGGGPLSCRCNAFGTSPSFGEILGQLFLGAVTLMALLMMTVYQRRFW